MCGSREFGELTNKEENDEHDLSNNILIYFMKNYKREFNTQQIFIVFIIYRSNIRSFNKQPHEHLRGLQTENQQEDQKKQSSSHLGPFYVKTFPERNRYFCFMGPRDSPELDCSELKY